MFYTIQTETGTNLSAFHLNCPVIIQPQSSGGTGMALSVSCLRKLYEPIFLPVFFIRLNEALVLLCLFVIVYADQKNLS